MKIIPLGVYGGARRRNNRPGQNLQNAMHCDDVIGEKAIKLWLDLMPFQELSILPVRALNTLDQISPRKQGRWGQREAQGTTPGVG
jgi:hypothetical protein